MAISYICGFEMGTLGEAQKGIGASPTIQSSVVKSGSYALNANGSDIYFRFENRAAGGTNRASFLSCRFYFRVATLPTSNFARIWGIGPDGFSTIGSTQVIALMLLDTGAFSFTTPNGSAIVSTTN